MGIGYAGGLLDLLWGRVVYTKRNVVVYCIVEQYRLLVDTTHVRAQVVDLEVAHIDTVDGHTAAIGIVESRQHIGQCGLTRTALSYHGDRRSGGDVKIDVAKHRHTGVVREVDMVVSYRALERLYLDRIVGILDRILGIEYRVDARHRCQTRLYTVHRLGQFLGRIDDRVEYHHVVYERRRAQVGHSVYDECAAKPQHDRYDDRTQQLTHRVGQRLPARYLLGHTIVGLVLASDTVAHLVLGIESLDYTQASQRLLDIGHEHPPLRLIA